MSHETPPDMISPRSDAPLLRSARSSPPTLPLSPEKEDKYEYDKKRRQGMWSARRSIKTYSIVILGLTVILFLASYHGNLQQLSTGISGEHPLDTFARGFPRLRDPTEEGFLDDVRTKALPLFDWPRTTKMFVL